MALVADEKAMKDLPGDERYARKPMRVRFSTVWPAPGLLGLEGQVLHLGRHALAFRDELAYMLATQRVAPNSPQCSTPACTGPMVLTVRQGHFYIDPFTGKLVKSKSAYEHPQPHACFISPSRTIG